MQTARRWRQPRHLPCMREQRTPAALHMPPFETQHLRHPPAAGTLRCCWRLPRCWPCWRLRWGRHPSRNSSMPSSCRQAQMSQMPKIRLCPGAPTTSPSPVGSLARGCPPETMVPAPSFQPCPALPSPPPGNAAAAAAAALHLQATCPATPPTPGGTSRRACALTHQSPGSSRPAPG